MPIQNQNLEISNMEFKSQNRLDMQQGQIIIIALVFVLVITSLVGSLVAYTLIQSRAHKQAVGMVQAINIAEAGVETGLWKLNNASNYSGETDTAFGNGTYTITITGVGGTSKVIKVDAFVPNRTSPIAHRIVQMTATLGSTNISFRYGVQVGAGGLVMDNNSSITGNVFANGNITGATGTNIYGDAYTALTNTINSVIVQGNSVSHNILDSQVGGNASHYDIKRTNITGNSSSHSMTGTPSNCSVGGSAAYNTISGCTITGAITTPNPSVPVDQAVQPFPIADDDILAWQQDAVDGGILSSSQTINGTVSLGPKKIQGNLTVTNGSTLIIRGTLWVTGQVRLSNGSTVKLDTGYGSASGIIIAGVQGDTAAGYIDINNIAQILGSGTAGSFTIMISLRNNISSPAIQVANNATGAILYAPQGLAEVVNNAQLKEITAYKLHLNNNADIVYDSGLANTNFSSGPGAGWELMPQSWQLLQ